MSRARTGAPRVLLVLPSSTYRASDFLDAAKSIGAEVVIASEEQQALAGTMGDRFLRVDLCNPESEASRLASDGLAVDAVVGVDEQGVTLAAHLAARLGLAHNPPKAVVTSRDKLLTRIVLSDAGLDQPAHRAVTVDGDVKFAASAVGYPCVVKGHRVVGSRGVIRANNVEELASAAMRVSAIIAPEGGEEAEPFLVEGYVPGAEVAIEGLLREGAISRSSRSSTSPIRSKVRTSRKRSTSRRSGWTKILRRRSATPLLGPAARWVWSRARSMPKCGCPKGARSFSRWPLDRSEVSARARLKFGAGISLEEVILRHAAGMEIGDLERSGGASGVMMIPIAESGLLRKRSRASKKHEAVDGVVGVEITIPTGQEVKALPEGDRYLGFMFATGAEPSDVEARFAKRTQDRGHDRRNRLSGHACPYWFPPTSSAISRCTSHRLRRRSRPTATTCARSTSPWRSGIRRSSIGLTASRSRFPCTRRRVWRSREPRP